MTVLTQFETNAQHIGEYKNVFVDGIFDMTHYGHQNVVQNAIATGAEFFGVPREKIRLIVGICGPDEELTAYKRPSIYSIEEKMTQMFGIKGVYKVLNSPLVCTNAFIDQHGIDLVVAGDDYNDVVKINKFYKEPYERGVFKTFKRTPSICTSTLIKRVVKIAAEVIASKLDGHNVSGDRDTVKRFLKLLEDHL